MLQFIFLVLLSFQAFATEIIKVATFDSGFGGYFSAKEIEREAARLSTVYDVQFEISHFGDTKNAPYGEKSGNKVAELSAKGISKAFEQGAEDVFIACNTASVQFEKIKLLLKGKESHITSIIESSVTEARKHIDELLKTKNIVHFGILATPATVRSMTYPKAIAKSFGVRIKNTQLRSIRQKRWFTSKGKTIDSVIGTHVIQLQDGKKIIVHQMAPANWVDMIEHGAPEDVKISSVKNDLKLLSPDQSLDVVGEFCTHYPVFDKLIQDNLAHENSVFIKQAPLMAGIFRNMMEKRLKGKERKEGSPNIPRASMYLSGDNLEETIELTKTVFPDEPLPLIKKIDF